MYKALKIDLVDRSGTNKKETSDMIYFVLYIRSIHSKAAYLTEGILQCVSLLISLESRQFIE